MFNNSQRGKKDKKNAPSDDILEKSRQLADAWLNSDIQKRIEEEKRRSKKDN